MTSPVTTRPDGAAAWHQALFYQNPEEYVCGVLTFVTAALNASRPVFVCVPFERGALLRAHLEERAAAVRFADMTEVGRNPGRVIAVIRAFIDEHPDRQISFVGEPMWAGRSEAEIAEATRHEALINAAFEGTGARVLCPYDVAGLSEPTIADAYCTHPEVFVRPGQRIPSARYSDPHAVWAAAPLLAPPPPDAVRVTAGRTDLGALRATARDVAAGARFSDIGSEDFVLVVTELATNSVIYGGGIATVTLWTEVDAIVCDVQDEGTINDPFVGRVRPDIESPGSRGLWIVNQLCDLLEIRSGGGNTQVRATMRWA